MRAGRDASASTRGGNRRGVLMGVLMGMLMEMLMVFMVMIAIQILLVEHFIRFVSLLALQVFLRMIARGGGSTVSSILNNIWIYIVHTFILFIIIYTLRCLHTHKHTCLCYGILY